MTSNRADAAIAAAPPDAVELRIVRYRLRKSAGQAVSEWAGDAFLGGDDGPSDGPRPLRTNVVHWLTAVGGTVVHELPKGEDLESDDIARLLAEAKRRNLRCAVWIETDRLGGGSMKLSESWFAGTEAIMVSPVDPVRVESTPDGVIVTVDEFEPPNKAWLLFYPVLLVTFAWVFFLVLGALPRMLRENWQRSMVGVGQRFTATLDEQRLTVDVVRSGREPVSLVIDRSSLVAVGTAFGFTAFAERGAVDLPNEWASTQLDVQRSMAPAIASAINQAIGVISAR